MSPTQALASQQTSQSASHSGLLWNQTSALYTEPDTAQAVQLPGSTNGGH